MKITKNSYVSIEYSMKDEKGNVLDSSSELGPLEYVQGYGELVAGLESALMGREEGDAFSLTLSPKDAYGEYDDALIFKVNKNQFPPNVGLEVGMEFETDSMHTRSVRIIKIEDDVITIDANHPLAGKTLHFDIKVLSTRMASDDEIAALFSHSCSSCSCGCSSDSNLGCGGCAGCH